MTDPVAWVNVGFHHIPRDEDQSPMPVHWQNFQLVPRDFFSMSPTVTDQRVCMNGPDYRVPRFSSCVAVNRVPPEITTSGIELGPGSILTASSGDWSDEDRIDWEISYMWFRGEEPILTRNERGELVPVTDKSYEVVPADRGHSITVKVTASRLGFGSGTATSNPVSVPVPPTPRPSISSSPEKPLKAGSGVFAKLVKKTVKPSQNAKVNVTVKPHGTRGVATGVVRVRWGGKVLRSARLKNGKTQLKLPKLRQTRKYTLRVDYLGSQTLKSSRSNRMTLGVKK